jgi:hypothetical protein
LDEFFVVIGLDYDRVDSLKALRQWWLWCQSHLKNSKSVLGSIFGDVEEVGLLVVSLSPFFVDKGILIGCSLCYH